MKSEGGGSLVGLGGGLIIRSLTSEYYPLLPLNRAFSLSQALVLTEDASPTTTTTTTTIITIPYCLGAQPRSHAFPDRLVPTFNTAT